MVTNLFMKELSQILVKPPCARNFATPINFVVNAYGVPRACAEPHCKEYRTDGAGGAVSAVTGVFKGRDRGPWIRDQKTGTKGQRDKGQGC